MDELELQVGPLPGLYRASSGEGISGYGEPRPLLKSSIWEPRKVRKPRPCRLSEMCGWHSFLLGVMEEAVGMEDRADRPRPALIPPNRIAYNASIYNGILGKLSS